MMRAVVLLILIASPAMAQESQLPRTSFPNPWMVDSPNTQHPYRGPWVIDCSMTNCSVTNGTSSNTTISSTPSPTAVEDGLAQGRFLP